MDIFWICTLLIDQFCKLETIDSTSETLGNNIRVCGVYSLEPRAAVYCVRLNFNIVISKSV